MLDNGMAFTLVPWRTVVEQRLGQHVSAIVRDPFVTWQIDRQRGIGICLQTQTAEELQIRRRRFKPYQQKPLVSSVSGHCLVPS